MTELTADFCAFLSNERQYQDAKWGVQVHSGHAWAAILVEEVGEFVKAVNNEQYRETMAELVQVAAVACAAWEQARRGDGPLAPAWGQCKQTPAEALEVKDV
jgi:hypothetical protein